MTAADFQTAYKNRRVFITGHTGFKGSWLSLWLSSLGADVSGYALDPETTPNHWDMTNLSLTHETRGDIRDATQLAEAVKKAQPDIVFHLAAQPLVRRSYRDPLETFDTNVMGTANLLEACRQTPSVRAIVVITTDKCYENKEWEWGYRENDRLGGHDPYSASKACTEIVANSYRQSFFLQKDGPLLATARAGNVIGGGDWSEDRLIPDMVRSVQAGKSLTIRAPNATRPWQHVLDPLSGYLLLGKYLLEGRAEFAEGWNFGPDHTGNRTVEDILTTMRREWPAVTWEKDTSSQPHEATLLQLDSTKARQQLGWAPRWSLDESLRQTANWYRHYIETGKTISAEQLAAWNASVPLGLENAA